MHMRTLRLFLLAQQKEELCCSETVVEAFAWLRWEKIYHYLKLKKNALFLRYSRRRFGTRVQLHLLSSTSIRTTLTQCHGALITPQLSLLVSTSLICFMSLSSTRMSF